jgi:hypothetical protein
VSILAEAYIEELANGYVPAPNSPEARAYAAEVAAGPAEARDRTAQVRMTASRAKYVGRHRAAA